MSEGIDIRKLSIPSEGFDTWDDEKEHFKRELTKLDRYGSQLGTWLNQFGVEPDVTNSRINAVIQLLLDTGLVSEKEVMLNEMKYANEMIDQLEKHAAAVRKEAFRRGVSIPPLPTASGLITPGG